MTYDEAMKQPVTYDEAITRVRTSVARMRFGKKRAATFEAFDRIVEDIGVSDDVIRRARDELVATVPDIKAAVDRILAERIERHGRASAKLPLPRSQRASERASPARGGGP